MWGEGAFYVYRWLNTINGKAYVGKGRGRRAWAHLNVKKRPSKFQKALASYGQGVFVLEFLVEGVDETTALMLEEAYIDVLGTMAPPSWVQHDVGGRRAQWVSAHPRGAKGHVRTAQGGTQNPRPQGKGGSEAPGG